MAKTKAKPKKTTANAPRVAHAVSSEPLDSPVAAPAWVRNLVWVLRFLIIAGGIYYFWIGDWVNAFMTLLCVSLIIAPSFFTRGWIRDFPIEIDLLLFIIVFVQFILGSGESNFYVNIPYSDKIVHFMFPMIIGLIGFMMIYTLYHVGRLNAPVGVMMLLIVLVTLAVAGGWELVEYSSDRWFYPDIIPHHFQGNAQQGALDDTMTDIFMGLFGGLAAAILGAWLIKRAESQKRPRFYAMLDEIGNMFNTSKK